MNQLEQRLDSREVDEIEETEKDLNTFKKATWFSLGLSTGALIISFMALLVQLLR